MAFSRRPRPALLALAGGERRPAVALAVSVAYLSLTLTGCLSVRTTGSKEAQGVGGGVALLVFANDSGRRAGNPGPAGIVSELERMQDGRWKPVFRSLNAAWTVAGLPPGDYRVRFPARLDAAGNVVALGGEPKNVTVQEGRVTQVQAVLDHVPTALVVVAVALVVVAIVLLVVYLQDHDLPLPPPPPPEIAEAVFYVSLDLAMTPGWVTESRPQPLAVTSHFPAGDALVAARRPRVIFALSEAARPGDLHGDAVAVLGEKSGLIPGTVSYDGEHWWVVWTPSADLTAADTYHVTLQAEAVEGLRGNELANPVSFAFRTAK
jgi:hypothetical protein